MLNLKRALRGRPNVQLYSVGLPTDEQLTTVTFAFSPTINVRFRTGELVSADASLGPTGVNMLPAIMRPGAVPAYVLSQLRAPRAKTAALLNTGATSAVIGATSAVGLSAHHLPCLRAPTAGGG